MAEPKAGAAKDETREPEEIERDIERTRAEMAETTEKLVEKADVKRQAKRKVSAAKGKLTEV